MQPTDCVMIPEADYWIVEVYAMFFVEMEVYAFVPCACHAFEDFRNAVEKQTKENPSESLRVGPSPVNLFRVPLGPILVHFLL